MAGLIFTASSSDSSVSSSPDDDSTAALPVAFVDEDVGTVFLAEIGVVSIFLFGADGLAGGPFFPATSSSDSSVSSS